MTIHINPKPLIRAIILVIVIILFSGLCSCSKNFHIRQLQKKAPELFKDTLQTITIDTVIVDVPKVDTLLKVQRDTIIEYLQGEVKIRYKWNTKTDSIFIEADCPDSEIVEKIVTKQLPPIVLEPTIWQQMRWGILFIAIGIVVTIIFVRRL